MEDIYKSSQNVFIEDYKLEKYYKVHVSYINNPHSFYVRPINRAHWEIFQVRGKPVHTSDLLLGLTVVYRSQISNKYIRGNIVGLNKCDGQTVDIFAIDYGHCDESVDIKDIFKCKTVNVPPLARHCRLANCEPFDTTFTDDVKKAMETYIGREYCLMKVKAFQGGKMIVQLNNSCPHDIATMLGITHFTNFGIDMGISVSRLKSIQPTILNV